MESFEVGPFEVRLYANDRTGFGEVIVQFKDSKQGIVAVDNFDGSEKVYLHLGHDDPVVVPAYDKRSPRQIFGRTLY